jgi:hypothetical protein
VLGVLNASSIANVSQECLGAGAQACHVMTGFIHLLPIPAALTASLNHRGAAGSGCFHPVRGSHGLQRPGDVPAMADVVRTALEQPSLAKEQPIYDFLKSLAAAMLHRDQEVCAALFEVV